MVKQNSKDPTDVKYVSATEAKNRLGSLVNDAASKDQDIIIENRGRPKAVILSYDQYENLNQLLERLRREEAVSRLEQLREGVSKTNKDLSQDRARALADRFSRDVIKEMIAENKLAYEQE